MNRLLLSIALPAVLAGLAACSKPEPPPAPEVPQPVLQGTLLRFPAGNPQLAQLRTYTAAPSKAVTVELPARLVWNEERTQRLYAPFAGRVSAIKADVSQPVKAGTLLAQLASPDFGQAQADAARAETDLDLARKALARQKELFDAGIVPRKELEQAQAEAARASAELTRSEARIRLYGAGASRGRVDLQLGLVAGINGVVVERNINPGQEVRPDQSGPGVPALFVISDPSSLWVQIDARETEVASLRPGAVFELTLAALPGQKFEGTVLNAADFIDPSTRTVKVRGVVANPQRLLKAEMLATARFQRSLSSGVVVPATAVLLRGDKHFVFVQSQPGAFESREVQLGYQGAREVVISSGLEVGEQVVNDNVLLLARQYRIAQQDAKAADPTQAQPDAPAPSSISARPAASTAPAEMPAAGGGTASPGGTGTTPSGASSTMPPGTTSTPPPGVSGTAAPGASTPAAVPVTPAAPSNDATQAPRPTPPGAVVGGERATGGVRP